MNTIHSCGVKINPISVDEIVTQTEEWLSKGRRGIQITGINLEQIALLAKDLKFKDYLNASDVVNIDGMIVYWFLKLKGFKLSHRTLCADLFDRFLNDANEKCRSIYLLGATQETIEVLVNKIQYKYRNIHISGYHNGYFEDEKQIVEEISRTAPDYLFIGMPSPFKERFITTYKKQFGVGICFGVGGMFDIMAGKAKRAPRWIQKCGMEWLYRITQNPVGHSKRVLRAIFPCLKVFLKHLFEPRKQVI